MPDDLQRSSLYSTLMPMMEKPEYRKREEIQEVAEGWKESGPKIQQRISGVLASTSLEGLNEEQDAAVRALLLSMDALEQWFIARKDRSQAKKTKEIRKTLAPRGSNALTQSSYAQEIVLVSELVAQTKRPDIQAFLKDKGLLEDASLVETNHKAFEAAWKAAPLEQQKEETSKIKEARKQFDEGLSLLLSYLRSQEKRKGAARAWALPLLEEIEKAEEAAALRREGRSKASLQENPPAVTTPSPLASENKPSPTATPLAPENKPS